MTNEIDLLMMQSNFEFCDIAVPKCEPFSHKVSIVIARCLFYLKIDKKTSLHRNRCGSPPLTSLQISSIHSLRTLSLALNKTPHEARENDGQFHSGPLQTINYALFLRSLSRSLITLRVISLAVSRSHHKYLFLWYGN